MTASLEQIAAGAAEYITREVAPNVPDQGLRIALGAFAFSLRNNPAGLAKLLNSPAAQMLLAQDADGYQVDGAINAIRESVQQNGPLTLTIPPVPLISREEKSLSFGPADIDKLRTYIERATQ